MPRRKQSCRVYVLTWLVLDLALLGKGDYT